MLDRMGRLGHVPALDGIRGLAIALVVSMHAFGFPAGGFIGVDLFFVLSGFLITTLLLEEVEATGRISLRDFYERRVRRLLPALLVLLIVYSVVEAARGRSVLPAVAGLFYFSNFSNFLHLTAWRTNALDHLWSLAEEEQFYLVWPPILILLVRWRRLLAPLLLLVLAVLVAHRIELVLNDAGADRVDFALDTRSDGIIVGCILAIWRRNGDWLVPVCRRLLLVVGPVTVVLVFLLEQGRRPFPLLLPVVVAAFGALVVVAAAEGPTARALSNRPLVYLGSISYSLYLWHVPILFAFGHLSLHSRTLRGAIAVAISLALAAISTRYVEARFRRRRQPAMPRAGFEPA
jgi:peptidoglycan/LPS O-acetylase OafA/YrhL